MGTGRIILCVLLMHLSLACRTAAKDDGGALIIKRVFAYSSNLESVSQGHSESYSYLKYNVKTNRRNIILLSVPTMFAVAHGGDREHVGETYDKVEYRGRGNMNASRVLERTTIPHRRKTLPTLLQYLTPNMYGEILIDKHILSPFNRKNRKYYRYWAVAMHDGTATVTVSPKIDNTQLVSGQARVDASTGRIINARLDGEYDMVRFSIDISMGERGMHSYIPKSCHLMARFRFLGNDIATDYHSVYGLPKVLEDSVTERGDTTLLNMVRPMPLTEREKALFAKLYTKKDTCRADSTAEKKKNRIARMLWDNVGEHLLGRIKSNFGNNDQGYFRINPLLNPLYFGYSGRKGLVYKFDVRSSYYFSPNSLIAARFKSGYSFKQKRFYFNMPVTYTFDQRHNGYVQMELGNGNRITNSSVADEIKNETTDSIDWDKMNLTYFNDFKFALAANYDISPRFGIKAGLTAHRRSAVEKAGFVAAGLQTTYSSAAPTLELKYRPKGYRGPVITMDYERSVKGLLGANLEYERYELDFQHIMPLSAMSSLQMRAGTGFYTHRNDDWIFLDYANFHDNNIPGGWNDEWACDFELLNSNWYNASEYYVRANLTYESPLLLLSWVPMAGRFMEKERIYVNALAVRHLHPYMEYGYGFKTRLFSMGMFVAQKNWSFDGVGFKFGLELFRDW